MDNPFRKTTEQIAADMSIHFFGYPKQSKCRECSAPMWIHFEGAEPGRCDACRAKKVARALEEKP